MPKTHIAYRVNENELELIEKYSEKAGYDSPSAYSKALAMGGGRVSPAMKKVMMVEILGNRSIAVCQKMDELFKRYQEHTSTLNRWQEKMVAEVRKLVEGE